MVRRSLKRGCRKAGGVEGPLLVPHGPVRSNPLWGRGVTWPKPCLRQIRSGAEGEGRQRAERRGQRGESREERAERDEPSGSKL